MDAGSIAPSTTVRIPYDNPAIVEQAPGQVSCNAGVVTFLQEGIYSINMKIAFIRATNPGNAFNDLRFSMVLAGGFAANGAKLVDIQQVFQDRSNLPGSDERIVTLQYTGYFAAGDAVWCDATLNSAETVNLLVPNSGLIICKLI